MRLKSLFSLLLAAVLLFSLSACGAAQSEDPTIDSSSSVPSGVITNPPTSEPGEEEPVPTYYNQLTGENTLLNPEAVGKKPVAITINNIRVAQKVQCGLDKADVVFETEVEGGITRLLALFSDVSAVEKIGTVRSLRVVFADLAAGMNALLFYHGIDNVYCTPHLKSLGINYHQIGAKTDSVREDNGLSYEHRLYTTGELLDNVIESKNKWKTEGTTAWLNFRSSADKIAPSDTKAVNISVPFSSTTTTQFIYDEKVQKYARARKDVEYVDALSGNRELFTNVFILETTISNYDDGYHRKVSLEGGNGYYASAGGIVPIKWTKGDSKDNFKFTLEDGTTLTVNQGNSYICIKSKAKKVSFE